jgi:arginase family enzyme
MPPTISLIGIPTDQHSSFLRGPAGAPAAIRAALASEHGNSGTERGTEIGLDFALADRGDVAIAEDAGDDERIRAAIAACPGQVIALGGDHAISFPVVETLARRHGAFDILHFDAHPDLYDELDGNRRSHASPFARIMEGGHARRLVQVGIRTLNRHCREQAARFGVEIIEARHFPTIGDRDSTGHSMCQSISTRSIQPLRRAYHTMNREGSPSARSSTSCLISTPRSSAATWWN